MSVAPRLSRTAPNRHRTLLIAPHDSTLPDVDREVQRVMNALSPRLLFAEVTTTALVDELQRSKYDIIWFAGHSSADGLALTDGVLEAERLVQLLRQQSPRLVFLNSCASLPVAMEIHQEVGSAVIATIADVADPLAFTTGAQLAAALAAGMPISEAYLVSRPGANRQYVLLGGQAERGATDIEADEIRLIRLFNEWGERIEGKLVGLETRVNRRIDDLQDDVDEMRGDVQRLTAETNTLNPAKRLLWSVGFAMLFMPVIGYFSGWREFVDVSWQAAYLFAGFCYVFAALLFGLGMGIIRIDQLMRGR
jgi:hypothetical protein